MKKGFTLMELLIVMVIVTIMVTIAVPKYKGAMERGRGVQAVASLGALSDNLNAIYVMNGNTYGKNDSELNNLPSRVMALGGNTNTNLFNYNFDIRSSSMVIIYAARQGLGDKSYTVSFLNQNGEVTHRFCMGYETYCNLLGASKVVTTPDGPGWEF